MYESAVHLSRLLLFVLIVGGCQEKDRSPPSQPPPAAPVVAPAIDAAAGPPKPGDTLTLSGLNVRLLDGGAIELTGLDRWGAKLDTTYENREYLTKAMPTLERSLTSEQAAKLKRIVESLP